MQNGGEEGKTRRRGDSEPIQEVLGEADGVAKVGTVTVYLLDFGGRERPRPDGHREDVACVEVKFTARSSSTPSTRHLLGIRHTG